MRVESRPGGFRRSFSPRSTRCVPRFGARNRGQPSIGSVTGEVWGDADRLQQVMWNLLSNAVKFTPPVGRIEVAVEELAGAVQDLGRDNGAGIDSAFLPHVFERFRQADSSTTRMQAGLGLGLAIVRHLVDLHGGDGDGSERRNREGLDVYRDAADDIRRQRAADTAIPRRAPSLTGIRVLAVDDDEDSRELILLTVRAARKEEVMVVSSAARALDAIATFRPHVVISDLAMPGMDGYALVQAIVGGGPEPPGDDCHVGARHRARHAAIARSRVRPPSR